jgi:uncharacterized membrane protein YfcA
MSQPTPPSVPDTNATTKAPGRDPQAWKYLNALGLPSGSVRALMGLIVMATVCAMIYLHPKEVMPAYATNLLFLILGHYFATRRALYETELGPPPLFLPHGSIRLLTILGFGVVIGLLISQSNAFPLGQNQGVNALVIVAGFLLGVVWGNLIRRLRARSLRDPKRVFEDIKAILAILAAVLLAFFVVNHFHQYVQPRPGEFFASMRERLGENGLGNILAAIVAFYFGNRS